MKTIVYVTLVGIALLFQVHTQGQAIPNTNFENWISSGTPPPFDWEEPTDWKSTNSLTEWTLAGVRKTTDAYVGSFACQLSSVNISGGWPSVVCNGVPELMGDPFSDPSINIITGGTPISAKPIKLTGFYKFENNNPIDSGYAVVILKKYNSTLQTIDTVGMGDFLFSEKSTFTSFEITINDWLPAVTPDSIVIAFYSTDPKKPYAPDLQSIGLIVDSISLVFPPTSIEKQEDLVLKPVVYPNPASDFLTISLDESRLYELRLYTIIGQPVKIMTGKGITKLDVSTLPKGHYFLRTTEILGKQVFTQPIVVE